MEPFTVSVQAGFGGGGGIGLGWIEQGPSVKYKLGEWVTKRHGLLVGALLG